MSLSTIAANPKPHSGARVAQNFGWTALEMALVTASMLIVGIAVARIIGPRRLAYFNYVYWLTTAGSLLGSLGIPMTTFKYMGELLGAGDTGSAKAVYRHSLRWQTLISVSVTLIGVVAVFVMGDREYRLVSLMMVLSVIPQMVAFIPSQANCAAEDFRANTMASLVAEIITVVGVVLSLVMHWDLVGIAATILLCRLSELVAKVIPVARRHKAFPNVALPEQLRKRMFSFTGLGTGLLLLQVVVWDRSDIVMLKWFSTDIKQIAFFSVAFTIADRLLKMPQAFGSAVGATQMAEYGRDRQRLFRITGIAGTYVFMAALPMLVGAACLSAPLISTVYGAQYLPAISVFAIVAIFAIPKAVLAPAQSLLYSTEDLKFLLKWGCLAGIVNVALDALLIPRMGATGAAFGNGLAQTFAAAGIWGRVLWRHPVKLNFAALLKVAVATIVMAAAVVPITLTHWANPVKMVAAVAAGALVFMSAVRLERVLSAEDRQRLVTITKKLPAKFRATARALVEFLAPVENVMQASS